MMVMSNEPLITQPVYESRRSYYELIRV